MKTEKTLVVLALTMLSANFANSATVTVKKQGDDIVQKTFAQQTKPLGINLAEVSGDKKDIADFSFSEAEISNEQYARFLNEAFALGLICYDSDQQMVFDNNGDAMVWLGGSRVVKDHNRDGVYELEEMENPLNRCFIGFDQKAQRFFVVDPAKVDWEQYFDPEKYPNVVDGLEHWAELNPENTGWYGEGDKDKELPTLAEVKTWPATFVRYYGANAFASFYGYDLPTKAQWQYAGKGGKDFVHATSDGSADRDIAWINIDGPHKRHRGHVQPVKSKKPNPYGIYNMGGNVWEWVEDWWKGTQVFFSEKNDVDYFIDPSVTSEEANGKYLKGLLGGSFNFFTRTMRVDWNHAAKANVANDHFGFRIAFNGDMESVTSLRAETIKAFDKDGNGKLDQAEQKAVAEAAEKHFAALKAKMKMGARGMDGSQQSKNRDGATQGGNRGPQGGQGGNSDRRAEMIKKYDKDGDGKLSQEEREELRKNLPAR